MKNRIRELRTEKGLTQAELSKILNVSSRTVGFYETEERDPDTSTLKKLADFFDVTIDYLLGISDIRKIKNSAIFSDLEQEIMEQKGNVYSSASRIIEDIKRDLVLILAIDEHFNFHSFKHLMNLITSFYLDIDSNSKKIKEEVLNNLTNFKSKSEIYSFIAQISASEEYLSEKLKDVYSKLNSIEKEYLNQSILKTLYDVSEEFDKESNKNKK